MMKITTPSLSQTARPLIIPVLVMLIWQPSVVQGQNFPDAGQILRELRQPPSPGVLPPPSSTPVEPAPETAVDEIKVTITKFDISGNTAISNEDLQDQLTEQLGRRLGLSDLRNAAARLTALYRERGYPVARAYLPAQDIRGGKVSIVILEGNIGKVLLRNASTCPTKGRLPSSRTPLPARSSGPTRSTVACCSSTTYPASAPCAPRCSLARRSGRPTWCSNSTRDQDTRATWRSTIMATAIPAVSGCPDPS